MKIAVVGGGISGLVAAWHLGRQHQVDLWEAESRIGGHTHTVEVEDPRGPVRVDTGFIVFNDSTYPEFQKLLRELGVLGRPTTMSFSVRDDDVDLEYRGMDLWGLFAQSRNLVRPRFWRLLADFVRFRREAEKLDDSNESLTVGEFLQRHGFSDWFIRRYFLPMGSAVWSCPRATFESFPIRFIIDFYRNHGMLGVQRRPQWRVVEGGSSAYVSALLQRMPAAVHPGVPIVAVRREADGATLFGPRGDLGRYDHVVMACHADQSLRILGDQATSLERELLPAFPYEENEVVLHYDSSILPRRRRAWASWNYFVRGDESEKASVTYNMNLLQGLAADRTYCVTLNDSSRIDPQKVLRRLTYHHPIFQVGRRIKQARHAELIDHQRFSYCGAYWANGFHEDGVRSALAVVEGLGQRGTEALKAGRGGGSDA